MKKLLFSALLLTLVFALTCGATDTRVQTLGNANNILRDEANIFLFPQTINLYRGMVVGEVSTADMLYRIGAHYDMGAGKCVFGVYVDDRNLEVSNFLNEIRPLPNTIGSRLNLFWGRPIGDMDFGLNLSVYHNSLDQSGSNGPKASNTALGLNLGLTVMKNLDLALGFNMDTWTNKDAAGAEINKPKGNIGLDLGGRYWWAYSNEVDFVPHLNFMMQNEGYTQDATDYTSKNMGVDVGWGVNIRPVDRVLVLFDFGIDLLSNKVKTGTNPEFTTTYMNLPYYKIGLEGHVTKWWDLRLGAVKEWNTMSNDNEESGTTTTNTYLGSGFHFGNLTLDANINPQVRAERTQFRVRDGSTLGFPGFTPLHLEVKRYNLRSPNLALFPRFGDFF